MTAPTRSTVVIFASAAIAPGGTKASPVAAGLGAWVDVRSLNGGQIGWSVKNGASAPGAPGQFTIQVGDGNDASSVTNITELWTGAGTLTPNEESSNLVDLPATASFVRALNYGNTTNSVTFRHVLFGKA